MTYPEWKEILEDLRRVGVPISLLCFGLALMLSSLLSIPKVYEMSKATRRLTFVLGLLFIIGSGVYLWHWQNINFFRHEDVHNILFFYGLALMLLSLFRVSKWYEMSNPTRILAFVLSLIFIGIGVYRMPQPITNADTPIEINLVEPGHSPPPKGKVYTMTQLQPLMPVYGNNFTLDKIINNNRADREELNLHDFNDITDANAIEIRNNILIIRFKKNIPFDSNVTFRLNFKENYRKYLRTDLDFNTSGWIYENNSYYSYNYLGSSSTLMPFRIEVVNLRVIK